jgi:hypothetical protein
VSVVYECACREAAELSFGLGVEHLVLATAVLGSALNEFVDAETVRDCIHARERDALASLGISLESVRGELEERHPDAPCDLPVAPEAKRVLALASKRRRPPRADDVLAVLVHESNTARRLLVELEVPVGTLQARLRR